MAKQLNVSLNFTTNAAQAKAQMQELQRQLNNLGTNMNITAGKKIKEDMLDASKAAAELKSTLDHAMNANTGRLDLTKFSAGLKTSGRDLEYYRKNLQKLGPEGSQAFLNLATAIQNAESPLIRTNSLLGEMWTTLKNTARWQFSSSILHGLQGAFQSAYGYAKDLNESLNDIRIVTGQNVEQMAEFAKYANSAAKSLGSTTTKYTDAALIYYQQGLSDTEVQKRTDTTIKMANVTGENATEVSSYMTAIWNNFDDGSKSMEYFADVITKLGAETAASSAEIAGGLEKFAAIGETVGLSYEYATAALTTIIDKTRQSEDVVGTALKTIFARIQGLKMGEETEDGLDLNKYSSALAQYGIEIFDANRNLKDMDVILDEMGAKWETLNRAQKVGLAQTVAGVRQYNQLVSLMDNWDAMQGNLSLAKGAEGSLQAQSDIYAESWEAASNRVKSSLEELYSTLIDDDFFIKMTNFAADTVNTIDSVVDGLGGVKGMLLLITSIVTTKLAPQLSQGLAQLTVSVGDAFTKGKYSQDLRQQSAQEIERMSANKQLTEREANQYKIIGSLTQEYEANVQNMSQLEKEVNKTLIERQKLLSQQGIELKNSTDQREKELEVLGRAQNSKFFNSNSAFAKKYSDPNSEGYDNFKNAQKTYTAIQNELKNFEKGSKDSERILEGLYGDLLTYSEDLGGTFYQDMVRYTEAVNKQVQEKKQLNNIDKAIPESEKNVRDSINQSRGAFQHWSSAIVSVTSGLSQVATGISSLSALKDTLSNEDLTTWEKMTQTMISLGMAIPTLSMGFKSLATTQNLALINSLRLKVGLKTVEVQGKATGAAVLKAFLPLGAAIAAVTLVITALGNEFKKEQQAFDSATEEVEKLSQAFEEAKKTSEELKSSLENYENSLNGIKALKDGTLEFDNAIKSANQQAHDLIDTFEELNGKYKFNAETGLIEFDKDALKDLQDSADKKEEDAYNTLLNSKQNKLRAENDLKTTSVARSNNTDYVDYIAKDLQMMIGGATAIAMETAATGMATTLAGALSAASLPALAGIGIGGLAGVAGIQWGVENFITDHKEEEALDKLSDAMNEFGEYEKALNSLSDSDQKLIRQLDAAGADVRGLCQAVIENTVELRQINKEKIHNWFEDSTAYSKSGNKDLILELANNAYENQAEQLRSGEYNYNENFWQGLGDFVNVTEDSLSRTDLREQYAAQIGATDFKKDGKGSAQYLVDGNWTTVSDATAQNELIDKKLQSEFENNANQFIDSAREFVAAEQEAAKEVTNLGDIADYQEQVFAKAAEFGLTEQQAKEYMSSSGSMSRAYNMYELSNGILGLGELDTEDEQSKSDYLNAMQQAMGSLSDEDLQLALSILPDAQTVEEFQVLLQTAVTESLINGFNSSADTASEILGVALENKAFSKEQFTQLMADDNFVQYMEEQNQTLSDLTTASFTEQYAIISEFYTKVKGASYQSLEDQKNAYGQELSYYVSALDEMSEAKEEGKPLDFEYDEGELNSKIDQITSKIQEISEQQINIAIEWDGIDVLENGYETISDLNKDLKSNMREVGGSYQMTAAQAREWMEVYPDLFKTAKVNTQGIIELDKTAVNNFIEGQDAEADASVDAKLIELAAEKESLKAKLELAKKDLEMAEALATGKVELEGASAEYLADLRENLIQYYMDLNYDEEAATEAAYTAMGIDAETYSTMIAEASSVNAENMTTSAEEGATNQASALQQLSLKWQQFTSQLKNVARAVKKALSGEDVSEVWSELKSDISITRERYNAVDLTKYDFSDPERYTTTAALGAVSKDITANAQSRLDSINAAITSITNQETYLKALQNQDLTLFGEDTVDNAEETSDKVKECLDRYHEITKEIESQERALKKLQGIEERLYGRDKLKNLQAQADVLKDQIQSEKDLANAQLGMLAIDKANVVDAFKNVKDVNGVTGVQFDKAGNISNYTALKQAITNEFNALENPTDEDEEAYQDKIDYLDQYEETLKSYEDQVNTVIEKENEWYSLNYERLTEAIELRETLNENDRKALDFEFNSLSGDIYKASEALALLYDSRNNDLIDNTTRALRNNELSVNQLKEEYALGEITKAQYLEGLQEEHDKIYDNLEELQNLDEQMKEYYGNTLDMAMEELSKYTSHMDNLNSVLDHYRTILELTGREQNYGDIDKILKGQEKTLKNNYDVSKKNYEMLLKQKEAVEARLKTMDQTDAGYAYEKEKLDKLIEQTDEAYDEMLSDAEEYLTVLNEIWENSMNQLKETTEKALTAGKGFDSLMDSLSNLKTYQDEYLTKTNQQFETQKMLSDIQKEIDKTDSVAAKERLNSFSKEIEQLEEKDKLSNLELEIAQAKYKQLQAQIALEEAQNAKSTVRLSRDNEGNYGYVYTADQDAISEAEDELAQAENDLYNIRLDATNEYGEKMLQAEQEYMDKVAEVWEKYKDDEVTRNQELARLKEEYYNIIDTYSDLYTIAQQEDTNVVADAWINQYDEILGASLNWKVKLEEYITAIEEKHEEWEEVAEPILDNLNLKSDELATSVKGITDKSDEMVTAVTKKGGVIDTLGDELTAVNNVTGAYNLQRDAIQEVIDKMKERAKLLAEEIQDGEKEDEKATEWNTHVEGRITELESSGKTVAVWTDPVTGQKHYTSYDPKKKTEEEVIKSLEEKYGNKTYQDAAGWNENIATKLNDTEKKKYHGYDVNGKYHYAKTEKKLKEILDKNGGQMPGSTITYYDTGGYTGEWGPEGKLAMLHEKEIVLNKEDSANILKVVELVRAMIDSNVANAGLGILHSPGIHTQNQNLEQTVTITAEFPNATNHSEIEMAFNSLINKASQYANRK